MISKNETSAATDDRMEPGELLDDRALYTLVEASIPAVMLEYMVDHDSKKLESGLLVLQP